jgi:hypothetical protein
MPQPTNLQSRRGAAAAGTGRLLLNPNWILLSVIALIIPLLLVHHALWEPEVFTSAQKSVLTSNNPSTNIHRLHNEVSCPTQVKTRNDEGISDPNKGMDESPKRYTITNPPFWISLHKKYFDAMRWVSIMGKGNYYETGITEQFREILGNTTERGLVLDIGMNIGWVRVSTDTFGS